MGQVTVAGTNTAHIAPDGDGVLTGVTYVASGGYDAGVQAPDGLSCVFTATTPGTGFTVTCNATNSVGNPVTATAPLDDVVAAANPVLNLNLTVTNP